MTETPMIIEYHKARSIIKLISVYLGVLPSPPSSSPKVTG